MSAHEACRYVESFGEQGYVELVPASYMLIHVFNDYSQFTFGSSGEVSAHEALLIQKKLSKLLGKLSPTRTDMVWRMKAVARCSSGELARTIARVVYEKDKGVVDSKGRTWTLYGYEYPGRSTPTPANVVLQFEPPSSYA